MLQVGDECVLMMITPTLGAIPITHNSREFPNHPCRGKIVKVGRKWVYMTTIGAPWKAAPWRNVYEDFKRIRQHNDFATYFAVPVDIAKRMYEKSLFEHRGSRTEEFIAECVRDL